jgi:hypothetical protein
MGLAFMNLLLRVGRAQTTSKMRHRRDGVSHRSSRGDIRAVENGP